MSGFVFLFLFCIFLNMKEIWRPIPIDGYEDIYEVSNLGRVRSIDRYVSCNSGIRFCKGHILKPAINNCGYQHITLCKNQKLHSFRLCRIVAKAFVPNPNNLPCVNHKDECKTNDVWTNLEWVDYKFNNNYGTRNERISNTQKGIYKPSCKSHNETSKKAVMCVDTGEVYQSLSEIQRTTGYNHCNISMACRGKLKTAYGKHWIFI